MTRPGRLVVLDAAGDRHTVTDQPAWRVPQQVQPVRRIDGLVAHRPDDWTIEYGDPMWQDYRWVAMLDPVELSEHTVVADLRDGEHRGRPAWRAVVAAAEGYDPRCGCCPLLWSEISERSEAAAGGGTWREDHPDVVYPLAYEIALDVETGVVVELTPIGGDRPRDTIDLEIHSTSRA